MMMLFPFEAPTIFEGIHKSYFRMPRVVKDQKNKFENDDLFRQLSHESAVKYTGFKDRPLEERQMKFVANCQEGHTEISVVQSGIQFTLMFNPTANPAYNNEGCDFNKELGKVHIKAGLILNGVCVLWRGWVDMRRLEGFGSLEFDEYRAYLEDSIAKQQSQQCNTPSQLNNINNTTTTTNNNNTNNNRSNHQTTSPLGASQHLLDAASQRLGPSAAAAAAAAAAAVGLNPACLGAPPGSLAPSTLHLNAQHQPSPALNSSQAHPMQVPPSSHQVTAAGQAGALPPAPVTLADTSSYYGNAAIAAAAAAAFHQAFNVPGLQGPQQTSQHLHHHHHQQTVRDLQRFSGPSLAAAAGGGGAGLQSAPKLELQ